MAGVFFDVPGIGKIEAQGAASEATMQAILKALGGGRGGGGGGAGGGGGGAAGGAAGGGGGAGGGRGSGSFAGKMANQASTQFAKSANYASQAAKMAAGGMDKVTRTVSFLGGAGVTTAGKLRDAATSGAALASSLANVGDSLTAAAGALAPIPIVGGLLSGVLGAVAAAAEKVTAGFQDAGSAGASFGGSVSSFVAASGRAGMTMDQFGSFLKGNTQALIGFGATSEAGAKRFVEVSSAVRSTSSDLYALGYGTKEMNQGIANYGKLLKVQGIQEGKTTAELAKGAKGYLKEIDALAKITGVERSAKEAEMAAAAADAQFQGAMAGKSAEVRQSFLDTLGGLAGGMQGPLGAFAKDILATGTATTEENQRLMSMMGESASYLNMLRGKMQKGEAVSAAERNTLNNLMAKEGTAAAKQMGGAFATLPEFAPTMNAITLASGMQQNALKQSTAEQQKAAEETDKMNESISKMKEALAALTNKITMMLANSGGLGLLMAVFEKLANFVITVVLPGIGILIPILEKIFNGVVMLMQPVIESVTKAFGGLSGPLAAVDNILNFLFDTLNGVVRGGILIFESALRAFDTLAGPFNRLSAAIFGTEESAGGFSNTLIRIGSAVGQALEILAQVIGFVIDYAIIPLTNFIAQHLIPIFQNVWNIINDYLVPILVAAGVVFLAFNAITIAATLVKFALVAAMIVVTAGFALLSAGVAIVAGAFAALGWPVSLAIIALGALAVYFKKMGGDVETLGNGFKWLWSYIEELGQNLVKFYYYLMDKVTVGSEYKDKMAEQNKKIETTQADRAKLEIAMTEKMAANRLKREEEEKNAGKGGLMGFFGGMNDDRAEQHIDAKKLQTAQFKSQIPQALAGSVGPAVGDAVKGELSKSDTKTDYNAGPEGLLKQFGTREGSALAGAESSRQGMVAEAEKKKDEAQLKAEAAEEARAAAAKSDPRRLDQETTPKTQESAETLLANLNTKMEQLLKYAHNTTDNTYATVVAARGLTKDLFKSV